MLKRTLSLAALLSLTTACDTNVREVTGENGFFSFDGERVAVVHYKYEGFNNIITNGTGPGSRDHQFAISTIATPPVNDIWVQDVPVSSFYSAGNYPYEGRLSDVHYVSNSDRHFIVARYTNSDDDVSASVLRLNNQGQPSGGWQTLATGRLERIYPTDDGAVIAVATRRVLSDTNSSIVVKFYDGDSLSEIDSHEIAAGVSPDNYGSTLFNGLWIKAAVGTDTAALQAKASAAMQPSAPDINPASPDWAAQHAEKLEEIALRRSMGAGEWSFAASIDSWANLANVPPSLYTFRSNGSVEVSTYPQAGLVSASLPFQDSMYRYSESQDAYLRYSLTVGQGLVTVARTISIAGAIQSYLDWDERILTFEYTVGVEVDRPYRASFNIASIDAGEQVLTGSIRSADTWDSHTPINENDFLFVALNWARDEDGYLRTCLRHGSTEAALTSGVVNSAELDTGCMGVAWKNLSLEIGQDCNGNWGGYFSDGCEVDCLGVTGGSAERDGCGVCDTDPTNDHTTCVQDCSGVYGGAAEELDGVCTMPAGMALVPEGDFIAGTPGNEVTRSLHAFYMDIYEVTAAEYHACVQAGACDYHGPTEDENPPSEWNPHRTYQNGLDNHPMNYVTWYDAADYCAWKGKRLPTKLEWEKAARGTAGGTYPWGDDTPSCDYAVIWELQNNNGDGNGCGTQGTFEIGSKPAGQSPYGMYDMVGNIAEWIYAPARGFDAQQFVKGGSYVNQESMPSRSSYEEPYRYHESNGIRCAQ